MRHSKAVSRNKVGFRRLVLTLVAIHLFNGLGAQVRVSKIDSTQATYFNHSFDSLFLGRIHHIDTNLLNFSRFDWTSIDEYGMATLSNTANPARPLFFRPEVLYGYDFYPAAYKLYQRSGKDIRLMQPLWPLTEVSYLMGSKREQHLRVNFSRLVAPRTTVGIDYGLINSPGYYKNHFADQSNVYFTARHQTKNLRYGAMAWYFHNKLINRENGGIVNDSIFENRLETDRGIYGVKLQDAKNSMKMSGFGFEQYFILLPPVLHHENDSLPQKRSFQLGRITHRFEYLRNQWVYTERSPLENFYKPFDVVLDSSRTYDSTYQTAFINRIQWSSLGYRIHQKPPPLHIYAGIELVNILQSDSLQSERYFQLNPYGGVSINLLNSLFIDGRIKVISGNWAGGDVYLEGAVKQYFGTSKRNLGNLFGQLLLANQSPSWFYQRYFSNHFRWENNFVNTRLLQIEGGYHFKGLSAGAAYSLIDRPVYLGTEARPKQSGGSANVLQLFGKMHLNPGRFDLIGRVAWQFADNDSVLRVPALIGRLRMLYTFEAIKDIATVQVGLDALYHSKYYADAWMPALRSFHLQNIKQVGNYPYVDAHVALKLKRARIFFQATNLFSLTGYHHYFTTPGYPMRDQRFCLGVNWRFYN
ncbi:MAG TPA: hypothetical protein PKE03_01140 [Bacteroidales bacterium]|nr:hypothetical protein [Bacteroidales bacterium]